MSKKISYQRSCGSCTACCIEPSIEAEGVILERKPAKTPCSHLCGSGCGVYEKRPEVCRSFVCGWLAGHLPFEAKYRPNNLGLLIVGHTLQGFETATMYEVWKDARKGELASEVIRFYADRQIVLLIDNNPPNECTAVMGPKELQAAFYEKIGQDNLRDVVLHLPPGSSQIRLNIEGLNR